MRRSSARRREDRTRGKNYTPAVGLAVVAQNPPRDENFSHINELSEPAAVRFFWHPVCSVRAPGGTEMLWTIFVVLLVLWLLGMVSSYTLGGFIHVLLIVAIAVVLIRLIQGRRPV
jgi:hypothetical protein